jgi:hypothetical protein
MPSTRPSSRSSPSTAYRRETGNIVKRHPDANARQVRRPDDLPGRVSATSDEIVTQVICRSGTSAAAQLVPILRPLIPQYGHLAALPFVQHADHLRPRQQREPHACASSSASTGEATSDIEVIRLQNASAAGEIVRVVSPRCSGRGAKPPRAAPHRCNRGRRRSLQQRAGQRRQARTRLRLRTLIAHLDTPLGTAAIRRCVTCAMPMPKIAGHQAEGAVPEAGRPCRCPGRRRAAAPRRRAQRHDLGG